MLNRRSSIARVDVLFFFSWYGDHRDLHSFLHDALPISRGRGLGPTAPDVGRGRCPMARSFLHSSHRVRRSEEHTSELQSQFHLVCRLLLEKKKLSQHANSLYIATTLE